MVKKLLGRLSVDFEFDYENCFGDGDDSKQTTIDDYKIGFFNAHMPERFHITEW